MSLDVMKRLTPKRVPVDAIGAAETRVSELKARAEAAVARRADAAKRIAEAKVALDAAAEAEQACGVGHVRGFVSSSSRRN